MSLKCAIDLSIPDIIRKYGQPMTRSQLIASLKIHPSKTRSISRLMRILTHSGFFSQRNVNEDELEVRYVLTDASRLLLKDHPLGMSMTSMLHVTFDPIMFKSWYQFSTWFQNEDATPFYTESGMSFWVYISHEPKLNLLFNGAMASDTRLVSSVMIEKCEVVFNRLESLVDLGGRNGIMAKAIVESFPQLKCVVFDLPHVVASLHGSENLKYVGGNKFEAIPPADAVLLKWIMHDWNDEECVKILKKWEAAITSNGKVGKVIIIDAVMENKGDAELVETQLIFDLTMIVYVTGKREMRKMFSSAGFSDYKVTPILGLRSIIEVYPQHHSLTSRWEKLVLYYLCFT